MDDQCEDVERLKGYLHSILQEAESEKEILDRKISSDTQSYWSKIKVERIIGMCRDALKDSQKGEILNDC